MRSVTGYAQTSSGASLERWQFERRDLEPTDVAIRVQYCGVCHSDLDALRGGFGGQDALPLVPGHEFVGEVAAVGADVQRFQPGDQVAVGNIVDSCGICAACEALEENFCLQYPTLTYGGVDRFGQRTQGAYSTEYVADHKFVYALPDELDPAGVAPLMCAGITVYSPLRHWNVGSGSTVGIVGIGGLGHIAVKLAHAMGAYVVGFTRPVSDEKLKAADTLGADEIVVVTDDGQLDAFANRFDFVIDTAPAAHDLGPYLRALKMNGTLCSLGVLDQPLAIDPLSLVVGRKSVAGGGSGGTRETQEMLQFCRDHNITADVEVIEAAKVNEALTRLARDEAKYRFVLDLTSM